MILTLHVPAAPNDVVQSDLVFPSQSNPFEAVPFWGCKFLSVTQMLRENKAIGRVSLNKENKCT
jgi:hypothetical protein